jgi:hypothetical protein
MLEAKFIKSKRNIWAFECRAEVTVNLLQVLKSDVQRW